MTEFHGGGVGRRPDWSADDRESPDRLYRAALATAAKLDEAEKALSRLRGVARELVDSWIDPALHGAFTEEEALAGYRRTVLAVIACRDLLDNSAPLIEEAEVDLSSCPYYQGTGKCESGCTTEPSCMTDEPLEGWPSRRKPSGA